MESLNKYSAISLRCCLPAIRELCSSGQINIPVHIILAMWPLLRMADMSPEEPHIVLYFISMPTHRTYQDRHHTQWVRLTMLNFAYFTLNFWIRHLYSTFKIIQLFIFLSTYLVCISLRGKLSFNCKSTASWLMFTHPVSFLPPSSPSQPQFSPNHRKIPDHEPLPYVEGCGFNQ